MNYSYSNICEKFKTEMLLLILIVTCAAQQHTNSFTNNWYSIQNTNYQFFDSRTFGMDLMDPCASIDNRAFRRYINSNIQCTGAWCTPTFSCTFDSQNCYNVEHIIDKRSQYGPNLTSIAANLVMAWGTWNQELGRLSYQDSNAEKAIVYGDDRVYAAERWIRTCAGLDDIPVSAISIFGICFVAIVGVVVLAYLYLRWKNRKKFALSISV